MYDVAFLFARCSSTRSCSFLIASSADTVTVDAQAALRRIIVSGKRRIDRLVAQNNEGDIVN
jgi:hypothetical protein